MILLKNILKDDPAFQYVVDDLELMSPVGQQRLLNAPWITERAAIEAEYDRIDRAIALLSNADAAPSVNVVRHQLMQLHDIKGTLSSLKSHILLSEIELFEVKLLAHLYGVAAKHLASVGEEGLLAFDGQPLQATLQEVFALLDPDNTGMAHFYIYDSYDPRLAPLRKALKENEDADIFSQQEAVQQEVIVRLCDKLHPYAEALSSALEQMGYLDLLLAKATQARSWQLCRPVLSGEHHYLRALFNPRLKQHNEQEGLRYQPVDIELKEGLCLITGANMAGKTVLLKTVGIAQHMAQFGMFVPAQEASLRLVDDVVLCIGDEQNEMNGLSSFASEIIKISDALRRTRHEQLLVLIDEPARTTNPIEGKAIVQAMGALLAQQHSISMVTTHYSQLGLDCRRLRVKGFVEDMNDVALTPQNINSFMDYSLVEDTTDEVPHEALRIAAILGCDQEMIALAQEHLKHHKTNG